MASARITLFALANEIASSSSVIFNVIDFSQKVEKLGVDEGETVTFDQVLAVNNGELSIGCPTVAGATVTGTVVKEAKAKKVIVYKYKRKSGYHKKNGHRQLFTEIKIDKINA